MESNPTWSFEWCFVGHVSVVGSLKKETLKDSLGTDYFRINLPRLGLRTDKPLGKTSTLDLSI